jgi:hypothetical protein
VSEQAVRSLSPGLPDAIGLRCRLAVKLCVTLGDWVLEGVSVGLGVELELAVPLYMHVRPRQIQSALSFSVSRIFL